MKELFFSVAVHSTGYFTCTNAGVFPDTANCALGRYFYCPQASGGKYIR